LNIGFGSKIETEQFSETVIAATDKDSDVSQNLIIDRVTGQFQLTWGPSKTGEKGRTIRASVRPPGESFDPGLRLPPTNATENRALPDEEARTSVDAR
jgi:hypothetical protein